MAKPSSDARRSQQRTRSAAAAPISRAEAMSLLEQGWPAGREAEFPYGEELAKLGDMEDDRNTRQHVRDVLDAMNTLLSDTPSDILKSDPRETRPQGIQALQTALDVIWGTDGKDGIIPQGSIADDHFLLRLLALYHDIGKVVVHDRHAAVGYHLLRDVHDGGGGPMRSLLAPSGSKSKTAREEHFSVFLNILAHHDQFGVLSTGEGALPLLCDTVEWRRAASETQAVQKQKRDVSLLMLVNLADIAVSMKGLSTFKLERVVEDWERIIGAISKAGGSRAAFAEELVREAQKPERAIERVARLFLDPCPIAEHEKRAAVQETQREVYQQMADVLKGDFLAFCTTQALLCKLDYFRGFISSLLRTKYDPTKADSARQAIMLIVQILQTIVNSYRSLTVGTGGGPQRVGVQMMGLTRRGDIAAKIISVLLGEKTEQKALRWIDEEVGAWLFID